MEEKEDIVEVATNYFDSLFNAGTCSQIDECLNTVSQKMTPDMQQILFSDFTADEIKAALFQMRPIKAAGLDGIKQRNVVVHGGQLKDPRWLNKRAAEYLEEYKKAQESLIITGTVPSRNVCMVASTARRV